MAHHRECVGVAHSWKVFHTMFSLGRTGERGGNTWWHLWLSTALFNYLYLQWFQISYYFSLMNQHHLILMFNSRQEWFIGFKIFYQIFKHFSESLQNWILQFWEFAIILWTTCVTSTRTSMFFYSPRVVFILLWKWHSDGVPQSQSQSCFYRWHITNMA